MGVGVGVGLGVEVRGSRVEGGGWVGWVGVEVGVDGSGCRLCLRLRQGSCVREVAGGGEMWGDVRCVKVRVHARRVPDDGRRAFVSGAA